MTWDGSSIKPRTCADTQANLAHAFTWRDSPEGWDFWNAISNRLSEMASRKVPTTPIWEMKPNKGLEDMILELTLANRELHEKVRKLKSKLFIADFVNSR